MFFAKIPRHIRQNAITEGDLECILTRNCEGTEQLRIIILTKNYFKVKQNGGTKKSQQSEKKEDVLRYLIARTLSDSYNEHQDF